MCQKHLVADPTCFDCVSETIGFPSMSDEDIRDMEKEMKSHNNEDPDVEEENQRDCDAEYPISGSCESYDIEEENKLTT
jgi:hypothetical protein